MSTPRWWCLVVGVTQSRKCRVTAILPMHRCTNF